MKHKITVLPQFSDSDILGHANFQATVRWFEAGRRTIYRLFDSNKTIRRGEGTCVVMVHMEIDYAHETQLDDEVTIQTWISRIGNSSFTIEQESLQNGTSRSTGRFVLVCCDVKTRKAIPISQNIREKLQNWA
jgi:acyl-CoA thioester hydrolase